MLLILLLAVEVVGDLQLVEIDRLVHPLGSRHRALRMSVQSVFEGRLMLGRSGVSPTFLRGFVGLAVVARDDVPLPVRGSRLHLYDDEIIRIFLQTADFQFDRRKHTPAIERNMLSIASSRSNGQQIERKREKERDSFVVYTNLANAL